MSLTVEQLEALARRAREQGRRRATFYELPGVDFVVEVRPEEGPDGGPGESCIYEDGEVR